MCIVAVYVTTCADCFNLLMVDCMLILYILTVGPYACMCKECLVKYSYVAHHGNYLYVNLYSSLECIGTFVL